eukprot:scaffold5138_cov251-Pinguiococcus_pyrenoidosus.AAC.15
MAPLPFGSVQWRKPSSRRRTPRLVAGFELRLFLFLFCPTSRPVPSSPKSAQFRCASRASVDRPGPSTHHAVRSTPSDRPLGDWRRLGVAACAAIV